MSPLDNLAAKFKKWRGSRRYCRFPKAFWDELQQLSTFHTPAVLSQTFGITEHYLRRKFSRSLKFAEVKVSSSSFEVAIEFATSQDKNMTVRVQASQEDVIRLILALSGQKS